MTDVLCRFLSQSVYVLTAGIRLLLLGGILVWTSQLRPPESMEPERPETSPSVAQKYLGVIIGVGLGLLFASLLVEWMRAMVMYLVVFTLGVAVLAPLVIGYWWGKWIAQRHPLPEWRPGRLLAVLLLGWSLAVGLPWGLRLAEMTVQQWLLVPDYSAATQSTRSLHWGDRENDADHLRLTFTTTDDIHEVARKYGEQLKHRGWQPGPKFPHQRYFTPYMFHRDDLVRWATIKLSQDATTGEYLLVLDFGDRD